MMFNKFSLFDRYLPGSGRRSIHKFSSCFVAVISWRITSFSSPVADRRTSFNSFSSASISIIFEFTLILLKYELSFISLTYLKVLLLLIAKNDFTGHLNDVTHLDRLNNKKECNMDLNIAKIVYFLASLSLSLMSA